MDPTWIGLGLTAVSLVIGIQYRLSAKNNELQGKIYQVEIWARDEFVRKASFESFGSRIERDMKELGQKIDEKFDKIMEQMGKIPHG